MPKFRKKPVVIEAFKFTGASNLDPAVPQWFANAVIAGMIRATPTNIVISTLEGDMTADVGDYVIQGVKGEIYPCKPDIFEATYDAVSDDTADEPKVFLAITLPRHRISLPELIETIAAQAIRGIRGAADDQRTTARQSDRPNEEIGEGVRMIGNDQSEEPVPFKG